MTKAETTGIVLAVILVALVGILFPFAIIWALNTLFALGIAYTFWTWLAVFVLNMTWFSNHKFVSNFKR